MPKSKTHQEVLKTLALDCKRMIFKDHFEQTLHIVEIGFVPLGKAFNSTACNSVTKKGVSITDLLTN